MYYIVLQDKCIHAHNIFGISWSKLDQIYPAYIIYWSKFIYIYPTTFLLCEYLRNYTWRSEKDWI